MARSAWATRSPPPASRPGPTSSHRAEPLNAGRLEGAAGLVLGENLVDDALGQYRILRIVVQGVNEHDQRLPQRPAPAPCPRGLVEGQQRPEHPAGLAG